MLSLIYSTYTTTKYHDNQVRRFFMKLNKHLLNNQLLKVTSLAIALTISLTACDKSAEKAPTAEPTAEKETSTQEISKPETQNESLTTPAVMSEQILASMAVDTASMSLEGMIATGVLNETQSSCVKNIDLTPQVSVVQGFIDKSFSEEERKELTDFYSQPDVQVVTNFGREQMLAMMGLPVETKATQPTEADMKKVIAFSQTGIGKKFSDFNMKEGKGTMNEALSGFILSELKKCGIDPDSPTPPNAQPNQPKTETADNKARG